MPQPSNDKLARKISGNMTGEQIAAVDDDYGANYKCNTDDAKAQTLKPSKDTKSPFGAMTGG